MELTARSGLGAVAIVVGDALGREGIRAVLTGGACANLYTGGRHQSVDADFIVGSPASKVAVDLAMEKIGFVRERDRYVHAYARFYVEFPRGPLAIGHDYRIRPVAWETEHGRTLILSATDSCRDRLRPSTIGGTVRACGWRSRSPLHTRFRLPRFDGGASRKAPAGGSSNSRTNSNALGHGSDCGRAPTGLHLGHHNPWTLQHSSYSS